METTVEAKRLYEVTFDDGKIGRNTIGDARVKVSSLEDLVDWVEAMVRPRLLSSDIGVTLDTETLKGTVTAGVRTVGRFTAKRVEPVITIDSSIHAVADHIHGGARCEWGTMMCGQPAVEQQVGPMSGKTKWLCVDHLASAKVMGWASPKGSQPERPRCSWDESTPHKQCSRISIGRYRLWGLERVLCDYHVKVTLNQNRPTLETW